jgi:hypothetical protein
VSLTSSVISRAILLSGTEISSTAVIIGSSPRGLERQLGYAQ